MEQPQINTRLLKDISQYCEMNSIDIEKFVNDILRKGFMLEKYGERPGIVNDVQSGTISDVKVKENVVEEKQQEALSKEESQVTVETTNTNVPKAQTNKPVEPRKIRKLQAK